MTQPMQSIAECAERAVGLASAAREGRVVLGLTGAPGSGKSTLAVALAEAVRAQGVSAVVVPMDGFHLAHAELERFGSVERKGAPDTFDASGFAALLRRLVAADEDVVYAPAFRREIEEPIAGAIPVPREVQVVIVEGNYLLLDFGPWAQVRSMLSSCWYVEVPESERVERLVARHVQFGRSEEAARAHALGSDQRNAELVAACVSRADARVRLAPALDGIGA